MTATNRTARRAAWTALPLGLALVGALALSPALAQDATTDAPNDAAPATAAAPRTGAFFLRRGPDGGFALRGMHVDPRAGGPRSAMRDRFDRFDRDGGDLRGEAFARWLEADADAGPIVPGLVGRIADGATVRLAFYDGAPEEGGTELAALTFVAGEDDATAFRAQVRTAAEGATHVVVDVLGRVVELPEATPADAAE